MSRQTITPPNNSPLRSRNGRPVTRVQIPFGAFSCRTKHFDVVHLFTTNRAGEGQLIVRKRGDLVRQIEAVSMRPFARGICIGARSEHALGHRIKDKKFALLIGNDDGIAHVGQNGVENFVGAGELFDGGFRSITRSNWAATAAITLTNRSFSLRDSRMKNSITAMTLSPDKIGMPTAVLSPTAPGRRRPREVRVLSDVLNPGGLFRLPHAARKSDTRLETELPRKQLETLANRLRRKTSPSRRPGRVHPGSAPTPGQAPSLFFRKPDEAQFLARTRDRSAAATSRVIVWSKLSCSSLSLRFCSAL